MACEPTFLDAARDVLLNPRVLFKVLSDSMEKEDRGRKLHEYRSINCFQEYVLVSQHRMLVEHYSRQSDGTWTLKIRPEGETLRLSCAPVEIPVAALYRRVKLPAP